MWKHSYIDSYAEIHYYSKSKINGHIIDKVVATGIIVDEKRVCGNSNKACHLISFDYKYYWNINYHNIVMSVFNKPIDYFIDINEVPIKSFCSCEEATEPCYLEYTKEELDEGVKHLVRELNKLEGITTTGSCDGHGKDKLYIQFYCNDLHTLNALTYACNGNGIMSDEFVIKTSQRNLPDAEKGCMFLLESLDVENAIHHANLLAARLQGKDE